MVPIVSSTRSQRLVAATVLVLTAMVQRAAQVVVLEVAQSPTLVVLQLHQAKGTLAQRERSREHRVPVAVLAVRLLVLQRVWA